MVSIHGNRPAVWPLAAVLLACGSPALAGEQGVTWSSSMQPQLELTTHLTEQLNIRFGINRFEERQDPLIELSPDVDLTDDEFAASALVDWELAPGGLRMTGGALYGDLGWGSGSLDSLTRSGRGLGGASRDDFHTYLGLGWDADFGSEDRLGLQLDLGVAFEGVPLESGSDGELRRAREDAELGQRFESFRYVPVFSAGVEYRF